MELSEIKKRLVRYGELKPCKTAFIDAYQSEHKKRKTLKQITTYFSSAGPGLQTPAGRSRCFFSNLNQKYRPRGVT